MSVLDPILQLNGPHSTSYEAGLSGPVIKRLLPLTPLTSFFSKEQHPPLQCWGGCKFQLRGAWVGGLSAHAAYTGRGISRDSAKSSGLQGASGAHVYAQGQEYHCWTVRSLSTVPPVTVPPFRPLRRALPSQKVALSEAGDAHLSAHPHQWPFPVNESCDFLSHC